jgi:carboxymethylenebutenolidase
MAPILLQMGDADEEVNPEFCAHVVQRSQGAGTPVDAVFYPGASHDFDDPGAKRQDNPANAAAKAAAMAKAASVVDGYAKLP